MGASQAITRLAFLCLVQVLAVTCGTSEEPPFYLKLDSMSCYGNPQLLVNITCRLKAISWNKTVAIIDSDLVGEIRNASLHFQLFKYTNQFRPFLLNVSLNLCDMLDSSKGNSYSRIILRLLTKYTSINHGCPYSGHLGANELYANPKYFPFTIPSGKYKVVLIFYEGWPFAHIGTVELVATVTEENPYRRPRKKKD